MAVTADVIEQKIKQAIPQAVVRITDLRGDGDHYAAYVESVYFLGKSRIQQHRMVQQALLGLDLHALALRTAAPQDSIGDESQGNESQSEELQNDGS